MVHESTPASAARRVREASSRTAPPPERQRPQWHAHAFPRESRLIVGARSWNVAPRSCTEGVRPPASAVPFHSAWTDHDQRGTARARGNFARCASSRETASAVARPRVCHAKAGGCWRLQLARRTTVLHRRRELPLAQRPSIEHGPAMTSAARLPKIAMSKSALLPEWESVEGTCKMFLGRRAVRWSISQLTTSRFS